MKTRHCEECKFFHTDRFDTKCLKLHTLRFYKPKHPRDSDWGWKRKCEDFEVRNENQT